MSIRVLVVTSEWPTLASPSDGIFVVNQVETLRALGTLVEVMSFRGKGNALRYGTALVRFYQRLGQGYDVIHAHFGQAGLIALLQRKTPVVVTFHGSDLIGIVGANGKHTFNGRILSAVSQLVARCADEVIVPSHSLARFLPQRPYHLIPLGVNLDLFRPILHDEARHTLGWPLEKRVVFFASDPMRPVKRYGLACQAVELAMQHLDVEMVVAGNIAPEFMPLYMNASDVLLVTSAHESGPAVVKEALACNLPVVSVDVGDVRQRIGSVAGCVVCADNRPETLAAGLTEVLRRRQRIKGRETVQDLDERVLTQRLLHVYEMALDKRKGEKS